MMDLNAGWPYIYGSPWEASYHKGQISPTRFRMILSIMQKLNCQSTFDARFEFLPAKLNIISYLNINSK